jgi:lysozyme
MPLALDHPDRLRASLKAHEGVRHFPYKDTMGNLTIGVGHNISTNGISLHIIDLILDEDIMWATEQALAQLPWIAMLDDVRKRAFVELFFNMGLKVMTFHQALDSAKRGDWLGCMAGFRESLWHRQVGHRAIDLERMLETGQDPDPLLSVVV